MGNLARFTIDLVGSDPPGYDATAGEALSFKLEAPSGVVQRWAMQVFGPDNTDAPTASLEAPLLSLSGQTTGELVEAATPLSAIIAMLPAGVHSWTARSIVNGGIDANGRPNPDYVFERVIAVRSASGLRKVLDGESSNYEQRGQTNAQNELIDFLAGLDSLVVPLSDWASGAAFDFATLTGTHGDAQTANIAPLVGIASAVPTGTTKPTVFDCGAYGQRGLKFKGATLSANMTALRIDALAAALFQGAPHSWCVAIQFRMMKQDAGVLWSANRSDNNSEYVRVSIFGFVLSVAWQSSAGLVTRSTALLKDVFGDVIVVIEMGDDGLLGISVQQAHTLDIVEFSTEKFSGFGATAISSGLNQFSVACAFTTVAFNGFTGHITRLYAKTGILGRAKTRGLIRSWLDASHTKRGADSGRFATVGDSETGATQTGDGGGWRGIFAELFYQRGWSYQSMATGGSTDINSGLSQATAVGNCFSSWFSSTTIADQLATGLADIQAAADAGAPLRFYTFFSGHGDCNQGNDPAVSTAAWAAAAQQLQTLGQSFDRLFRLIAFELYPIDPTVTSPVQPWSSPGPVFNNVLVTAFNAALPAKLTAFAAANPGNSMFFIQSNHALGGAWSAPFYADTGHLNRLGVMQVVCHQTYGAFRATDFFGQGLIAWWRQYSPSSDTPPPLTVVIDTPVAASSFNHANPLVATGRCSRIGATLVLKNGATPIVLTPQWTEIYVPGETYGGSTQYRVEAQWTATIPGGTFAAGAATLNAMATDVIDTTAANAPSVALTAT